MLIAGGVGITPIRALLEELTGAVTVLHPRRIALAGNGNGGPVGWVLVSQCEVTESPVPR